MEKKVVLLSLLLLVAHGLAILNSWYWVYPWIDVPMHFLGGVLAAVILLWLVDRYPGEWELPRNFFTRMVFILSFVALIGVLWEFSEFLYDVFISSRGWSRFALQSARDTIGDLFFDLLGGLTVVALSKLGYNKINRKDG